MSRTTLHLIYCIGLTMLGVAILSPNKATSLLALVGTILQLFVFVKWNERWNEMRRKTTRLMDECRETAGRILARLPKEDQDARNV